MVAPAGTGPGDPPQGGAVGADEDGDPGSRRRLGWIGLAVAGVSFLCGLVFSGLLGGTYAAARGFGREEAEGDLAFALLSALGVWIGFLALPLVWSQRHGGPSRRLGLSARWIDLLLGAGVGLASTIATALVSSLLLTRGEQESLESIATKTVDRAHGAVPVALLFVALCVVTPVAEEVFFRGLLLRSLHRTVGIVVALPLMGGIFGLLHFPTEPMPGKVLLVQLGVLSLFGMALGVLAHRTGRLGAAIAAHALFNAVTVVSLLAER